MNPVEIVSVVSSLIFLYLLIKQNIWCWPFGIFSSVLSVYLFIEYKLYSEAVLYACYVVFGVYGWLVWQQDKQDEVKVTGFSITHLLFGFLVGVPLTILVGYLAKRFTDAAIPYVDACTSVFGLIATYLEAHRYIATWYFWIVLNLVTTVVYYSRGLPLYAGLMLVYFVVSIYGYVSWRRLLNDRLSS